MARAAKKAPVTKPAPVDQDALTLKALAKAILAREFRPRVASVRRLAEAVLEEGKAPKKKKKKKGDGARKAGGKKRKLAKIPGQKKDRKKTRKKRG